MGISNIKTRSTCMDLMVDMWDCDRLMSNV